MQQPTALDCLPFAPLDVSRRLNKKSPLISTTRTFPPIAKSAIAHNERLKFSRLGENGVTSATELEVMSVGCPNLLSLPSYSCHSCSGAGLRPPSGVPDGLVPRASADDAVCIDNGAASICGDPRPSARSSAADGEGAVPVLPHSLRSDQIRPDTRDTPRLGCEGKAIAEVCPLVRLGTKIIHRQLNLVDFTLKEKLKV